MWKVDDGTGTLLIQNTYKFEYNPQLGESYNIKGPLSYEDGKWKIELTSHDDVSVATSIIETSSISSVTVFPVPATDHLNIEINAQSRVGLMIFLVDLMGRVVMEKQINCLSGLNYFSLNVNALSPGSYLLLERSGAGLMVQKVFIN